MKLIFGENVGEYEGLSDKYLAVKYLEEDCTGSNSSIFECILDHRSQWIV